MRNFGAYRGYVFLNPYISSVIKMIIAKGPKAAKKVLPLVSEPLPIFKGIIVVNCHTSYNYIVIISF